MAPRASWSNLLPGLIGLAAVVLIAIGVLVFAGVGEMRGDTIRLFVRTDQARGLIKGSEVWLEGQKIGLVERIGFLSPDADTAARVVIEIEVREKDAAAIRRDSRVQVRAGANLIGPVVVYLTTGTPESQGVREGDTLVARAQSDFGSAGAKLDSATRDFGPLKADARAVAAHLRNPNGTVGAARLERGGGHIARVRANIAGLRARLSRGPAGAAGPRAIIASANSALARADSIRALLRSPNASLGRFRRDSTLGTRVSEVRAELAELRARFDDLDGALGRFAQDSAVVLSVAAAQREMSMLFSDMKRHPLRYINF